VFEVVGPDAALGGVSPRDAGSDAVAPEFADYSPAQRGVGELRDPRGVDVQSCRADRDVALRAAGLYVELVGGLQPVAARGREPEHRLAERHQIRHADHPADAVVTVSIPRDHAGV